MHSNTPSPSTSPAVTITEVPLQPISGWGKLWQGLLLVASPAVIIPALIFSGMPLLIAVDDRDVERVAAALATKRVPIWMASAPSAKAAAMPRPSTMPPAALRGRRRKGAALCRDQRMAALLADGVALLADGVCICVL